MARFQPVSKAILTRGQGVTSYNDGWMGDKSTPMTWVLLDIPNHITRRGEEHADFFSIWMIVSIVHGPDACPRADIEDSTDFGVRIIWRRKSKPAVQRQEEEVMLQVFATC